MSNWMKLVMHIKAWHLSYKLSTPLTSLKREIHMDAYQIHNPCWRESEVWYSGLWICQNLTPKHRGLFR